MFRTKTGHFRKKEFGSEETEKEGWTQRTQMEIEARQVSDRNWENDIGMGS